MSILPDKYLVRDKDKIGGSDVAALFELDPFKSAYDVYLEKTEDVGDIEDSMPIEIGNTFERAILGWGAKQLGIDSIQHDQVRALDGTYLKVNLDADVRDLLDSRRVCLEAKSTSHLDGWGEEGTDQVPAHVNLQCQAQMACAEKDRVYVPVLLFGYRPTLKMFWVDRDDELISMIINQSSDFMEAHVLPRVPPKDSLPSLDVVKRIKWEPTTWTELPLDVVSNWINAKAGVRASTELKESYEAVIRHLMRGAEGAKVEGYDRELTCGPQKRTTYGKGDKYTTDVCESCGVGHNTTEFTVLRDRKAKG